MVPLRDGAVLVNRTKFRDATRRPVVSRFVSHCRASWRSAVALLVAGFVVSGYMVSAVEAGPIPPVLPGVPPTAGQSTIPSFVFPATDAINVDWMVVPYVGGLGPAPGGFLYAYQLENTSGVAIDVFTISLKPGTAASISASGVVPADDLDLASVVHPDHTLGSFPILATELDPFPLAPLTTLIATIDLVAENITWGFDPLVAGAQSDTLFFIHPRPPVYGDTVILDSSPPSPWGSLAPGGDPVPVPIPEPATLSLLGLGALFLGAVAARRRRK